MADPVCRACGLPSDRLARRVCPACTRQLRAGEIPDVRTPVYTPGIRSHAAVQDRIRATLARYPHLARPERP